MDALLPASEEAKARRRHLVRKGALLGRPLVGPLEAVVIPTYKCQYRCIFCALEWEAPGKKADIPPAMLETLIDDLAALDTEQISYTGGGEPLLHKGIDDLVARTREKGMAVSICTNGERLDQARIERYARLGVHLSVSLNAATPELYARIHPHSRPGAFERITEALAEFVRIAGREGGEGSFVSLNFVLMNLNHHEVRAMAALARRIGAHQIQYRHIQPRPVHANLSLSPVELDEARRAIREVEVEARKTPDFTVQVMEILRTPEPRELGTQEAEDLVRVPCLEGYIATYVDSDGVVFPCCMRSTSISNHWMGTLATERFPAIWFSDAYQRFRREAWLVDPARESDLENSCRYCPKAKQFVYTIDEMSPGNYGSLYRTLARDLAERVAKTRTAGDGACVLTPAGFRVAFVEQALPASAKVGETFRGRVTVRNAGTDVWPGIEHRNAVGLGYHLLGRFGRMVRFDNNPRAYLPADLPPGGEAALELVVRAPERPGRYFVELTMIQENVAWFETRGGATLRVPLRVVR